MEDSHTAVLDLWKATKSSDPNDLDAKNPADSASCLGRMSFFGVYDGHGGHRVALFTGANIYKILTKQGKFITGCFEQGLKDAFLATDNAILGGLLFRVPVPWRSLLLTLNVNVPFPPLLPDPKHENELSGCTACVCLVLDDVLYVVRPILLPPRVLDTIADYAALKQANAGDSRCVLSTRGRAMPLSEDHKPQLESG